MPANGGLSPDGWTLFAAQQDAVAVYDLRTGRWRELPAPARTAASARWLDAATIWVPDAAGAATGSTWSPDGTKLAASVRWTPPDLRQAEADEPYGSWVDGPAVAGSYFLAGPVPGGPVTNPEALIAQTGEATALLALAQADRGKGCCTAVGWLDEATLAFLTNGRVMAWQVGTARLYRVSELTGLSQDERVAASWAWRTLA